MNYRRLELNLEQYGRNTNYALVCGTFKPELRRDAKYKQWKRILERVRYLALSPTEKRSLQTLLEIKVASLQTVVKRARQLGNNELVEVLNAIPDITTFLGNIEDRFDSARFLGMLEELVDLYNDNPQLGE